MAIFTSAVLTTFPRALPGWGGMARGAGPRQLEILKGRSASWICSVAALLAAAMTGCGGNNSGNGDLNAILRPWVTEVAPANNALGVSFTNPVITVTFNEQMAPINGGATFTLSSALNANVSGMVALDSTKRVATFTPTNPLVPSTLYTATVNGFTSNTTGRAMENAYTWSFTTEVPLTAAEVPAEK